ncbi:MAG: DUF1572 family protein [Chitinophagales bacterium]|nr:DUF1572 family protein [Chitinophagales bacterium]
MVHTTLAPFFERDLLRLKDEVASYKNEADLWVVKPHISNSAGNLCLHLIGNLNHFIGATLGNTGYVRERDKEFAEKNIPRARLLADIDAVLGVVKNVLVNLPEEAYEKEFPLPIGNNVMTTQQMLIYIFAHLSYHLGQINYHRRLIEE